MRIFELEPKDGHKSFYKKAKVLEKEDGRRFLMSYKTPVCYLDKNNQFVRLWNGYSATTMRHINAFLALYLVDGGGKAWWNKQPVHKVQEVNYD